MTGRSRRRSRTRRCGSRAARPRAPARGSAATPAGRAARRSPAERPGGERRGPAGRGRGGARPRGRAGPRGGARRSVGAVSAGVLQVGCGIAFVALAAALAWRLELGLPREIATAAVRAIVQLTAVGALITLVFEY